MFAKLSGLVMQHWRTSRCRRLRYMNFNILVTFGLNIEISSKAKVAQMDLLISSILFRHNHVKGIQFSKNHLFRSSEDVSQFDARLLLRPHRRILIVKCLPA